MTLGMQVVEYAIDVENTDKARKLDEYIENKQYTRFGHKIQPD